MSYVLRFVLSFALVGVSAALSSYFSYLGVDTFYQNLALPPLNPPNTVFRFVWPILYILMIISFYIILNKEGNKKAVMLFVYQLFLHILWCWLFFAKGLLLYGLIDLVLLDITVLVMIKSFLRLDKTAAFLQYPYFFWLLFATYLNAGVWYLNGAKVIF
ncbi:MAG: tryptophan-rich sensory protein [Alphaproteobacteria bacterium]|nr:tryptophan-rich sensory protein [Alphaproteobacteria bacterium]